MVSSYGLDEKDGVIVQPGQTYTLADFFDVYYYNSYEIISGSYDAYVTAYAEGSISYAEVTYTYYSNYPDFHKYRVGGAVYVFTTGVGTDLEASSAYINLFIGGSGKPDPSYFDNNYPLASLADITVTIPVDLLPGTYSMAAELGFAPQPTMSPFTWIAIWGSYPSAPEVGPVRNGDRAPILSGYFMGPIYVCDLS